MATQLLGGNRAYYTPSFFGGATGFDPSGGVGTAAIGEAGVLRELIAAMLQGFTPGPGRQMSGGVDTGTGGSDFGSGGVGDAAGGSEMPVDPVTGQQTLNTISKAGQALGLISSLTGNPELGSFLNTAGQLSGAVAGAYNDPVREALQDQFNKDLEMAGLEGNIDYGSYGYNPAGVAAANIAPIFANVAGLSPIIGGLAREGIMLAADPVPSTPADLVKSGVDAIVPGILNAAIKAFTGNTIGEQMKGALTPVETAVPVEDRSTYPGEAPAGKTPEQALAEMLAEGVNVNMLDAGIAQVSDTIEPMSTQLEASGSPQSMSVESPVGTVSDTEFFSTLDSTSLAPASAAAAGGGFAMFPGGFALNLSPGWLDGISIGDMMSPEAQKQANDYMRDLLSGNISSTTPATPAAPVDLSVPESSGASMKPEVIQSVFNAMANYQQQMESSYDPGTSWDGFDYSGYSFG